MPDQSKPVKMEGFAGNVREHATASMTNVTPLHPASSQRSLALWDLDDPALYLNKELTWLAFNRRVLAEAKNEDHPLLERIKFLSIFDSNLDEFFMKRIGGLKQQVGAQLSRLTVDGRTPQQQIEQCRTQVIESLIDRVHVMGSLLKPLAQEGIRLRTYRSINAKSRAVMRDHYRRNVLPLITPLAIDETHPFPFVSNLSINLLLQVSDKRDRTPHLMRIKVPTSARTPRFMNIAGSRQFVALEDVIAKNLDLLLPGSEIVSVGYFRVTRNANVERDEETANDLLEQIESKLRERRFAPVVRLEVTPTLRPELRDHLAEQLKLKNNEDIYIVPDLLGTRDLMQIATLNTPALQHLRDAPIEPFLHPRLRRAPSLFAELEINGPLLLKHPYQSYDHSVTRLLREAVADPDVLAIKTTVYRMSIDSAIVPLLIEAVSKGKQVAVVVELQARFEEAANILWANELEEAGIHVSYGVIGYKTHAKCILIIRQDSDGSLTRFVHLGTGNYHAGTARLYCDIGLMTAEPAIGNDATELFNLLTSGSLPTRDYEQALVSPNHMKHVLLDKIHREIKHHKINGNGRVQLKTNALEDAQITRALYEACGAGVRVDLIIRDSCRLRPGLPGLSETARVISIVGRFLEHARIYYFNNDGDEEYFIGSADLMSRNLERRIELLAPVTHPALQAELRELLDLQLDNCRGAWEMTSNGSYLQRLGREHLTHSQDAMLLKSGQLLNTRTGSLSQSSTDPTRVARQKD